jgi:methylase of polypeptide subunit release factors
LPFIPATPKQLSNVFSCLPKQNLARKSGKLLDIGSGDGRIVIEAAKKGFISHGVELNPWLVLYSRLNALRENVHKDTSFFKKDLWKFNLSPYNYVVIFGVEQMMGDLEKKFVAELSKESTIVACR